MTAPDKAANFISGCRQSASTSLDCRSLTHNNGLALPTDNVEAATMNDLERLIAIEEIKQLKARYFRHMDMQDWDALYTLFTPDAVYDATDAIRNGSGEDSLDQKLGEEWINHGRDKIVPFIQNALAGMVSVHHGHMPEITIHSATKASGIWPMTDKVQKHIDGQLVLSLEGEGHYWEEYERIDGTWMISFSRLTRIRVQYWQDEQVAAQG